MHSHQPLPQDGLESRAIEAAMPCCCSLAPCRIAPLDFPVQDDLESVIVAAMPPEGQQPELWELKLGQYVNRSLTLQEYQSMIDGWATWPTLPAGYEGPAFTYSYFEPVEGERRWAGGYSWADGCVAGAVQGLGCCEGA